MPHQLPSTSAGAPVVLPGRLRLYAGYEWLGWSTVGRLLLLLGDDALLRVVVLVLLHPSLMPRLLRRKRSAALLSRANLIKG